MLDNEISRIDVSPDRLMAFTDAIFAVGITLLILTIELPDTTFVSHLTFRSFMFSLFPYLGTVILSFLILSSFWIYHHEYLQLKNVTVPFIWMDLIYLLFIMLIPFTTTLIGKYSQFIEANVLFCVSIALATTMFLLMFNYSVSKDLLINSIEKQKDDINKLMLFSIILIILISVLCYLFSQHFKILFVFVLFIGPINSKIQSKSNKSLTDDLNHSDSRDNSSDDVGIYGLDYDLEISLEDNIEELLDFELEKCGNVDEAYLNASYKINDILQDKTDEIRDDDFDSSF